MEQVFTIPEGFEIKKINDNQFSIVEKEKPQDDTNTRGNLQEITDNQMRDAVKRRANSFFGQDESRDDYDFGYTNPIPKHYDRELMESEDRDALFDTRLGSAYNREGDFDYSMMQRTNNRLRDMYNNGQIKKLNEEEMKLLRFCHGIDVRNFIKEEFERNPIILKRDENGYFYAETPGRKPDNNKPKQPSIYDINL